jgi:hypothetical protein
LHGFESAHAAGVESGQTLGLQKVLAGPKFDITFFHPFNVRDLDGLIS